MNDDYIADFANECMELYHYGILGQKWGVRRYQNSDGSLTSAGKEKYSKGSGNKKKKSSFFNEDDPQSNFDSYGRVFRNVKTMVSKKSSTKEKLSATKDLAKTAVAMRTATRVAEATNDITKALIREPAISMVGVPIEALTGSKRAGKLAAAIVVLGTSAYLSYKTYNMTFKGTQKAMNKGEELVNKAWKSGEKATREWKERSKANKRPLTDEERARSIEKFDLETINQHKREYSDSELQKVMNRVNLERNISNLTLNETTRTEPLDRYAKTMKQTVFYLGAGLGTYNMVAKLYNASHVGDAVKVLPGKLPNV